MPTTDPGKLNIYIYRIHVYLTYNIHTRPLDIGEILMSYPKVPTGGDYFWSKYWAAHPHEFDVATNHHVAEVKACDVRNSYALRSILSQPAMRTAETAAVPAQQAY